MKTIATNDNNDIYLGPDGNLAMATDLQACVQSCEHASQTLLKELPYAQSRGIAFFDNGLSASPKLGLYEVQLRNILLTVPNVQKVLYVGFKMDGTELSYEAQIQTSFGVETVHGNL